MLKIWDSENEGSRDKWTPILKFGTRVDINCLLLGKIWLRKAIGQDIVNSFWGVTFLLTLCIYYFFISQFHSIILSVLNFP